MNNSLYRKNASAVIFNQEGKVLSFKRNDSDDFAWQFPQGGIDAGESPLEAAFREIWEETSIKSVELIYAKKEPIAYNFPDYIRKKFEAKGNHYIGQEQYWFLFLFNGDISEINLKTKHPEFDAWKWTDLSDTPNHVVPFKKSVYETIAKEFSPIIKENTKIG